MGRRSPRSASFEAIVIHKVSRRFLRRDADAPREKTGRFRSPPRREASASPTRDATAQFSYGGATRVAVASSVHTIFERAAFSRAEKEKLRDAHVPRTHAA